MFRNVSSLKHSVSGAGLVLGLLVLPALLIFLDFPAETLAGCASYGYGCGLTACMGIEISTNQGYTWQGGSVYIYGAPGTEKYLYVRTVLGVLSGQIQGWSFGVRHDATSVLDNFGDFSLNAVAAGYLPVQCGYPPDFEDTQMRPCGYTQGVIIDTGSTACKVSTPADLVTSYACYRVVMPQSTGVYPVTLKLKDDLGDPPIRTVVTQNGQSQVPCKFDLTINVYSTTSYYPTPSYCPLSQGTPVACGEEMGGGGGVPGNGCSVDNPLTLLGTGELSGFPGVTGVRLWRGGSGNPPGAALAWTGTDPLYDDSSWEPVNTGTPIGYDDNANPGDIPHLLSDMKGAYSTFYVRIAFTPSILGGFDARIFSTLEAEIGVDDGFVAYINGREIRRFNVATLTNTFGDQVQLPSVLTADFNIPAGQRFSGYADLLNPPNNTEEDLAGLIPPLSGPDIEPGGTNVLAIQVFNSDVNDSECVLSPRILLRKRGPFLARSTVLGASTGVEVVIRAMEGLALQDDILVDYTWGGIMRTSNEVLLGAPEGAFGDETMYRIMIPGSFRDDPDPPIIHPAIPPGTDVTYNVFVGPFPFVQFNACDLSFRAPNPAAESFSFIAFGNSGQQTADKERLASVMNGLDDVDFFISAGDHVIRNNDYVTSSRELPELPPSPATSFIMEPSRSVESADDLFYDIYSEALSRSVCYVAPGDEDLETFIPAAADPPTIQDDGDYDAAYVMREGLFPGDLTGTTEQWYSFDYGPAHFTVLRSFFFHFPTESTLVPTFNISDQMVFAEDDLDTSQSPWKIVVMHHSPYTSKRVDMDNDLTFDQVEFRTFLETEVFIADPFGGFEDHGVDLVITGHERFFEASHAVSTVGGAVLINQLGPNFETPGAPDYIGTGGAGEPLWDCLPREPAPGCVDEPAFDVFTQFMIRAPHVTRVSVSEKTLTVEALDTSGRPIAGSRNLIHKGGSFRRADANQDGTVDITDAIATLEFLFQGGQLPDCKDAIDTNDDGSVDISDPVFTLLFLFGGGLQIPAPGPTTCGTDPTPELPEILTCNSYALCP